MKSNFMESFEFYQNEIDILHYGKKGMKWGVRNTQPYVPVAERTQENQNDSVSAASSSAEAVAEASPEKVSSTRKKVLKGLAIGGGVALVVGSIIAGGLLAAEEKAKKKEKEFLDSWPFPYTKETPFGGYLGGSSGGNSGNSNRRRTKAGMTSAGERLRRKVNGG